MARYRIEVETEDGPAAKGVADDLVSGLRSIGMEFQSIRRIDTSPTNDRPQPVVAHGEHGVADGILAKRGGRDKSGTVVAVAGVAGAGPAAVGESKERPAYSHRGLDVLKDALLGDGWVHDGALRGSYNVLASDGTRFEVHTLDLDNPGSVRQGKDAEGKHAGTPAPAQAGAIPNAPVPGDNAGAVGMGAAGNGGPGPAVKASSSASPTLTRLPDITGLAAYRDELGRFWYCVGAD